LNKNSSTRFPFTRRKKKFALKLNHLCIA